MRVETTDIPVENEYGRIMKKENQKAVIIVGIGEQGS